MSHKIVIFNLNTPAECLAEVVMPVIGTIDQSFGSDSSAEFFFKVQSFTNPGSIYKLEIKQDILFDIDSSSDLSEAY